MLNKDYVGLSNPNDYNNDGVINAFDMVVLKRMMAETEVSIDEFGVDLFDVHVNETETATFTAAVDSSVELEETAISVYDEDNNFITYLNDNGEMGMNLQMTAFTAVRQMFVPILENCSVLCCN